MRGFVTVGDVDGNGRVNALDQIAIDEYLADNRKIISINNADINED